MTAVLITLLIVFVALLLREYKARRQQEINNEKLQFKLGIQENSIINLNDLLRDHQQELINIQDELGKERERYGQLLSQKKSSESRLGSISENLIPLLTSLPYNSSNLRHLGQPIDYVYFNFDDAEVVFIEVKTGESKESTRQKIIKNAIRLGKVYYEKIQINEKGINVKRQTNV